MDSQFGRGSPSAVKTAARAVQVREPFGLSDDEGRFGSSVNFCVMKGESDGNVLAQKQDNEKNRDTRHKWIHHRFHRRYPLTPYSP